MTAALSMATGDWVTDALCAQTDPDIFHPAKGVPGTQAKKVCAQCPVQHPCLRWAVENNELSGIFGGMSSGQRRGLTIADVDALPPVGLAAEEIPPGQPLPLTVVPKVRPRPIPEPRPVPTDDDPPVKPSKRKLAECGTAGGYQRHLRNKETPCDPCKVAKSEAMKAYWQRKKIQEQPAGAEKPRIRVMWLLPPTPGGTTTEYAIDDGHGGLVPIHPNAAADLVQQGETIHARHVTDWVPITGGPS
jgi:WhiB family redox-sensing transcriptional regulator